MPAIATGQVKLTRVQTSRSLSIVDGKVAMAKSTQKPAITKPAPAHTEIRYFIVPLQTKHHSTTFCSRSVTAETKRLRVLTTVSVIATYIHNFSIRSQRP